MLDYNSTTPIYIQIANWLETEILKGRFQMDEKVYSQYQLADMFQINPATAAKGLKLLSEQKILYDRRGLGKFVSKDAVKIIKEKRKDEVLTKLIKQLVTEAHNLNMDETTLMEMINKIYHSEGGEEK